MSELLLTSDVEADRWVERAKDRMHLSVCVGCHPGHVMFSSCNNVVFPLDGTAQPDSTPSFLVLQKLWMVPGSFLVSPAWMFKAS